MPAKYRKTPTITFQANSLPLNQGLGYQAYGCSYQNLNDAWLKIGDFKFAAPNSSGTASLDGDEQAQVEWAPPPGTAQGANTADKVAYVTFTAEPLPDSGGPLALGMNNPMSTLGDIITGLTGGVATRLQIGTPGQVLTVVGGVPAWSSLITGLSFGMQVLPDADASRDIGTLALRFRDAYVSRNLRVDGTIRSNDGTTALPGIYCTDPATGMYRPTAAAIGFTVSGTEIFRIAATAPDFRVGESLPGGGAGATLDTIGGAGPTVAAQHSWLAVLVTGNARFIPLWA